MDRPAAQRLMKDVEAGKIDCIVVYKVDRLSRSLMDFARIMEVLEKHNVSFVSVTQQFNTATSMGRLVLNVLLSFAQFEREIISERTRDKIAAARRRGKWSGGRPVLGYDVVDTKLIVNEEEARRVRAIFKCYLEHEALIATVKELDRRGWMTKLWITRKGTEHGQRQENAQRHSPRISEQEQDRRHPAHGCKRIPTLRFRHTRDQEQEEGKEIHGVPAE